jgi:hypothetical protein
VTCGCDRPRTRRLTASPAASFRTYARDEGRNEERRKQHADPRKKGERSAQRVDEQPQIARVADDTIEDQS